MAATRNPTDIPFASNSVWNIGIGSNAQWSLNTDADARQLHGLHGTVNAGAWGQPIYFGTASDPLVTVTNTDPLYPVPPQQIHIPANALPAIGTDTHMAFYDATQPGKLWSYFYCKFVNGRDVTGGITTALGGVWDTTGDGITSKVFPGSNYNFAVGTITDYDVAQGAINHMVRIAISPDALKSPGATWTQNIPWPDTYEDYWGPQIYTGNIVAGSTFGIPKSVNLSSLGLSQGGMMLAKALQNYGGLWRDSGGSNQVIFYSTPENENNPLIQQMRADMAKIVPVMEIMRNQGPNSVNGGGTPVVPPLPPISLDGTTPPPVIVPPPPITFGTGPDSLVFQISEDAYANGDGTSDAKGDATFTVSVDGKQIGGTFTAAGSHAAGQEQTVTLNGYFGPGTHSVAVKFLNDAWGGTASTDRNLYVDSVKYQGVNINQSGSVSGTKSFSVTGGTSEPAPVPPPTSGQIVLTPTSGGSITDASGNVWTITPAGNVDKNGVAIPGGGDSAALTYVASTHTVWAQDAATHGWYSWTNGAWTGPAAASSVANPSPLPPPPTTIPPVVDPPVVNPPATGTPRAQLLAYLQSISGTHALIGQTTYSDNNAFNADTQAFGFSPAIMFNDPWLRQWAGNAPYDASFMPAALAHAKAGGIVGMSLLLPNPVDHGPSMGGPAVDPVQLLTPGSALNASLNRELDQAAGLLQQFKDAGDAVLTRFMFELDGGWFWWGDGHFSNAQQTQLYRYIVNYLRVTKGLDNLLTTFAINGGPGDYQYPGDDVVDIVGIDAYTDNLAGYKGVYDKLISQAPTKLFALTEEGSGDPSAPDPSYDLTRLKADIQSALPRTVYANFWQNWGPNLQANGKAAMSDPFWINKSQVTPSAPLLTPPADPTPPFDQTPITFGTGPDSLVFQISEDAYANGDGTSDAKGDATFTVSVDGKQIGGTFTAAGSHAAGQEQTVTLNGYFGPGTHSVAVKFLNDASGGTASTDRNLYVDSVKYQGVNINQSGSVSGTKTFTISDGTSVQPSAPSPVAPQPPTAITFGSGADSLLLQVSEGSHANGDGASDATFTVSVDGKQIGGAFTAAASHAAGQEQSVTLNGDFGPGAHSVAVKFLNDASGGTASTDRNLYVDSITYNGLNTNHAGSLSGEGSLGFTVTDAATRPDIVPQTPPKPIGAGDTMPTGSETNGGASVDLTAPGVSSVALGSAADGMNFIGMPGVAPAAGSVQSTAANDVGVHTAAGGKDPFGVTGGFGVALHDFLLAAGANPAISPSLQSSLQTLSDQLGGALLSVGVSIDQFALTAMPRIMVYGPDFL